MSPACEGRCLKDFDPGNQRDEHGTCGKKSAGLEGPRWQDTILASVSAADKMEGAIRDM